MSAAEAKAPGSAMAEPGASGPFQEGFSNNEAAVGGQHLAGEE